MLNLQLRLEPQTEERFRKILDSYQDQETFVRNIIAFQIMELKKAILNIRLDLRQFEAKYQLSTAEFYHRFTEGSLDDAEDFMAWAGISEMLGENERRLQGLI